MFRSLSSLIIAVTVALLLLVLGWVALHGGFFPPAPRSTSATIIEQIKLVAKLQTVEYHGATTKSYTTAPRAIVGSTTTVIYLLEGKVVAGVDLQKMQIEVTDRQARKVRLTLPEVEVENPVVKRFEILGTCGQLLAPDLTDEERNTLHQEMLRSLKIRANLDGIRDKARKQAEDYLRTFLHALGYEAEFAA
jgi:hypothetical protein